MEGGCFPKNMGQNADRNFQDTLMEDLIANAHSLFDDTATTTSSNQPPQPPLSSPPLPPRPSPSDDQLDRYPDTNESPEGSIPGNFPRRQRHDATFGPDFTPELPPRPGNSIHPSHRSMSHQTSSTAGSESDDDKEAKSQTPMQPTGIDLRAIHASEGSTTGSQTSISERPDELFAEAEMSAPSKDPSSPASVRSPLVPISELANEPASGSSGTVRSHRKSSSEL